MHMTIRKWGNSLATRIPKAVAESKKRYKLAELLSQCKPESMKLTKEDQEWLNAEPIGKEICNG